MIKTAKNIAVTAFAAVALALIAGASPALAYQTSETIVSNGHGWSNPQYLVVHETANPGASAWNHVNYWANNDTYMAHYVMELDGSTVYHVQADNTVAWHVGNGNYSTVGIELAHATNSVDFNNQWSEAVKWAGDYLNAHGWGIDRLLSHNDCRYIWGGTDHTDPTGYFAQYGKSWAEFKAAVREYINTGVYSGTVAPGEPTPQQPATTTDNGNAPDVHYAAYVSGGWLDTVTNCGSGSEGFAGIPYEPMRYVTMWSDTGAIRYQAHTQASGWLPWVYSANKNDLVNGAAGDGTPIDGIRAYYSSDGEHWYQIYYRVQTVNRAGYLATVCDDGTTYGGDYYAGIYNEGIDRLQCVLADDWPVMIG